MSANPKDFNEPYAGPKLKILRAKVHIENLKSVLTAYYTSKPYGGVVDIDEKTGQQIYKLRILKPIPLEVPTIIGDVIQNLRSALDHAACCLALQKNPAVNINDVSFPIGRDANEFESRAKESIKKLASDAVAFIKAMKPYGGGNEWFWTLHRLGVKDRHRLLLPVWAGQKNMGYKPVLHHPTTGEKSEFPRIYLVPADKYTPLEDGSPLASIPIGEKTIDEEIHFSIDVSFGDGEVLKAGPVVPTLLDLGKNVTDALANIEKRFFLKTP